MQNKILNLKTKNSLIQVEVADNFFKRFLGLMGKSGLPEGRGLLITKCNSVHMCFMKFPIDVVYIDENLQIKKIVTNLKPWIGFSMCLDACSTIELAANETKKLNLEVGQKFIILAV